MAIFMFFGLYRPWYSKSRTDEFAAIFRAISIGCIILFFVIFFNDERSATYSANRSVILMYWVLMILFVGVGRIVVRSFRKRLLMQGIGLRETIIVGTGQKAVELFESVKKYPALGYNVIGFVSLDESPTNLPLQVLGNINNVPALIKKNNIKNILIALDSQEKEIVLNVVSLSTGNNVVHIGNNFNGNIISG